MKIALLGLGSIGLRHGRNARALGHDVIGFDPDPARRAAFEAEGGCASADRAAVFHGAEAALVCSPNRFHLADMADAIAAGCHVMVEKPLAHAEAGVAAVLDAAAAAGKVVFPALNLRFHPGVQMAKQALTDGAIGRPLWGRLICASYLPAWRPHQDYRQGYTADPGTGGVLLDVIHEFDLAVHLLGPAQTAAAVAGRTGLLDMASEDRADVVLLHQNGVSSNIHLDYVTRPGRRRCEIAGSEGFLEIDVAGRAYRQWDSAGLLQRENIFTSTFDDDYVAEIKGFLATIAGAPPACTGHEALTVLQQVIHARNLSGIVTG